MKKSPFYYHHFGPEDASGISVCTRCGAKRRDGRGPNPTRYLRPDGAWVSEDLRPRCLARGTESPSAGHVPEKELIELRAMAQKLVDKINSLLSSKGGTENDKGDETG